MSSKDPFFTMISQAQEIALIKNGTAGTVNQAGYAHLVIAGGLFAAGGQIAFASAHNTQARTITIYNLQFIGVTTAAIGQPAFYQFTVAGLPHLPLNDAPSLVPVNIGPVSHTMKCILESNGNFLFYMDGVTALGDPTVVQPLVTAAVAGMPVTSSATLGGFVYTY